MNNFDFWAKYLESVKKQLNDLYNNKKEWQVDLHIHSNHSTDGKQTLKEIIQTSIDNKFDVISVTDHDSISLYDELYNIIKNKKLKNLIIIPGVEYTVNNKEYGGQCHILQYMINPKSEEVLRDVKKSIESYYKRCEIQFARLSINKAIKYFVEKKKIHLNIKN